MFKQKYGRPLTIWFQKEEQDLHLVLNMVYLITVLSIKNICHITCTSHTYIQESHIVAWYGGTDDLIKMLFFTKQMAF